MFYKGKEIRSSQGGSGVKGQGRGKAKNSETVISSSRAGQETRKRLLPSETGGTFRGPACHGLSAWGCRRLPTASPKTPSGCWAAGRWPPCSVSHLHAGRNHLPAEWGGPGLCLGLTDHRDSALHQANRGGFRRDRQGGCGCEQVTPVTAERRPQPPVTGASPKVMTLCLGSREPRSGPARRWDLGCAAVRRAPRTVQEAAGRPALGIRWSLDYVKHGECGANGD